MKDRPATHWELGQSYTLKQLPIYDRDLHGLSLDFWAFVQRVRPT
jgi:hypothetical protein